VVRPNYTYKDNIKMGLKRWIRMLWSGFRWFKTSGRIYESGNELTGLIQVKDDSFSIEATS